jgi:hypothetical protein
LGGPNHCNGARYATRLTGSSAAESVLVQLQEAVQSQSRCVDIANVARTRVGGGLW